VLARRDAIWQAAYQDAATAWRAQGHGALRRGPPQIDVDALRGRLGRRVSPAVQPSIPS